MAFGDDFDVASSTTSEIVLLMIFPAIVAAPLALSWRKERLGAELALAT